MHESPSRFLQHPITPFLDHWITPLLHHWIARSFRYSIGRFFHHLITVVPSRAAEPIGHMTRCSSSRLRGSSAKLRQTSTGSKAPPWPHRMVRLGPREKSQVQTSPALPCQFAETLPVCSASHLPFLRLHNVCTSACKLLSMLYLQFFTEHPEPAAWWFSTTGVVDLGHDPMVGPRRKRAGS